MLHTVQDARGGYYIYKFEITSPPFLCRLRHVFHIRFARLVHVAHSAENARVAYFNHRFNFPSSPYLISSPLCFHIRFAL